MFGSPLALKVKVKYSVPHAHFIVLAPGAFVPAFLSRARVGRLLLATTFFCGPSLVN